MRDWTKNKGTISSVLQKKQMRIFDMINQNEFDEVKSFVNKILNDSSLISNPRVEEAIDQLNKAKNNPNHYYSILMTFMTGLKVS